MTRKLGEELSLKEPIWGLSLRTKGLMQLCLVLLLTFFRKEILRRGTYEMSTNTSRRNG